MERPFLSDFTRRQWTSAQARSIWEPRISSFGAQLAAAELETVEVGIRRAALQNIQPEGLTELARKAISRGLVAIPLGMQGRPGDYAATPVPMAKGAPWDYRVVIARPDAGAAFVEAWGAGDDERIGELLGYPDCCRRFFAETWGTGSVDPTPYMGRAGDRADGPSVANILLRWAGVRYVPHMPCSFECRGSAQLGRQFRELVAPHERAWGDELLDMPMLYSTINSIGEVVTPLFSLNFRTDPGPEAVELRRRSSRYPEGSAVGLRFPYRPPAARRPAEVELAQAAPELARPVPPELEARDNGFSSWEAMKRAHGLILGVRPANGPRTVLDLGAGNGRLARALAGAGGTAIGVEADPERARRAGGVLDQVFTGDMFGEELEGNVAGWEPELTLFMPGRLLELGAPPVNLFLPRLRRVGGELLVYAYGDWLEKCGSLEALCSTAGLEGELVELQIAAGVEAGVWRWAQ